MEAEKQKSDTQQRTKKTPGRLPRRKIAPPKSCPPRISPGGKRRKVPKDDQTPKRLRVSKIAADEPLEEVGEEGEEETMMRSPAPSERPTKEGTDNRGNQAENGRNLDPFREMKEFMELQFRNTNEKIHSVTTSLGRLDEKVTANTIDLTRVRESAKASAEGVAAEIRRLQDQIDGNDKARREDIKRLEATLQVPAAATPLREMAPRRTLICEQPSLKPSTSLLNEEKYWTARRSFRLWPVPGKEEAEIWRECETYMEEKLKFPVMRLTDEDFESISRVVPTARNSKVHDEILVVFKCAKTRDAVASHARNLASFVGADGLPTAGLRPEVPDFLAGRHNDLERYGRSLKKLHGQGLRRSIRFDDSSLSVYMDVKLPDQDDWMRVPWQMASEELLAQERSAQPNTRRRLTSSTSSVETVEGLPNPGSGIVTGSNAMPRSETLGRFGNRAPPVWKKK